MADREATLDAIFTAENRQGTNQYNYRYKEDPNYYTASGYFQIVNSTWRDNAQALGVDLNRYPTAISAPYAIQRQVAGHILDTQGIGPWANYNPAVRPLIAQIDQGANPYLHSGPKDDPDGAANYLTLKGQQPSAPGAALGQSSGGLQFTQPARNPLVAPPASGDPNQLATLAMLQKLVPSTHSLQAVPYDPFSVPKPTPPEAMPGSAPAAQLHAMPTQRPIQVQSQAPGASGSAIGGLDKLLGDTGAPSSEGGRMRRGTSSQYE